MQTFTPRQFGAYAYNRTKAEIRDQFGSPDQVDESSDEWVYSPYSKRLAIEDMEAGKRVYVRITFFGDEGRMIKSLRREPSKKPAAMCLCEDPDQPFTANTVRDVGVDATDGCFADISIVSCPRCKRLWVRSFQEHEAFSRSGRWKRGLIDQKTAETLCPKDAAEYFKLLLSYIYGGSFYDGLACIRVNTNQKLGQAAGRRRLGDAEADAVSPPEVTEPLPTLI